MLGSMEPLLTWAGYRFSWLCDSPLLLPLWQTQTPSPSMLLLSVLGVCVPHVDSCPPCTQGPHLGLETSNAWDISEQPSGSKRHRWSFS